MSKVLIYTKTLKEGARRAGDNTDVKHTPDSRSGTSQQLLPVLCGPVF